MPFIGPKRLGLATPGYAAQQTDPSTEELLGQDIYTAREEALEQAEADREAALGELETEQGRAEEALVEARDAGLMGKEEYQSALAENREATEAQYNRISREMGEQTYGLAAGARRGATRELEMGRVGELGRGRRGIATERAGRRAAAYGTYGAAAAGLRERYGTARAGIRERAERPYFGIPAGTSPGGMRAGITGEVSTRQPETTQTGETGERGTMGFRSGPQPIRKPPTTGRWGTLEDLQRIVGGRGRQDPNRRRLL